ncbi:MAG: alpha-L-fucosidase [Clostridiales bacterium]|nr:alpha-L-fucosidase [Clostridiales bacterium]
MYENNWESLNSRPVPAWFGDAKFGIFIHWGLYSVPAFTRKGDYAEWYRMQLDNPEFPNRKFHEDFYGKNFKYEDFVRGFTAELFDAGKWAKLFKDCGAKYINFVSKHHDGFCLYKTDYAWNWNSFDVGPHRDFLMELKTAMEGTGVRFGVYHSVYEWFHPLYLKNPEEYALYHLIPMLKELVERYQPSTLFTDGEWDHPSSVWHSTEFLQWLYNESSVKDYIVPNDRWGKETRGHLGGNFTTEYGFIEANKRIEDIELDRPFEECRGIGRSFGLNRLEGVEDYMTPRQLLETLCSLVSKGGNFLLNIGPAADGTIPVIMEERLLQMGRWLKINGEAIYGSKVYTKKNTDSLGIYYTQKDGAVYAVSNSFPFKELYLEEVDYSPELKVSLLGSGAEIKTAEKSGKLLLIIPPLNPDNLDSEYLYTFKITK